MPKRMTEEEAIREKAIEGGLSASVPGALYGGVTALLAGKKAPIEFAKAALAGGAISAGIGGGGTYVGSQLMGLPTEDETTGYTRRATLGGGIIGALGGAAAGGLIGSGMVRPSLRGANILQAYFGKMARAPSVLQAKKAASIGGAAGGLGGAYMGSDEGMVIDFLKQEKKAQMSRDRQRVIDEEMKQKMYRDLAGA